jgi:hypothetical protein
MRSLHRNEDLESLRDSELAVLLAQMEREERIVSRRRGTTQDRIDFIETGGYPDEEQGAEQIESLRLAELALSERRRILHRRIDEVRAERDRRAALE